MTTQCTQVGFEFQPLKHRGVWAQFDGGAMTSDGGGLLLREVEKRIGILCEFAACFTDYRNADRIEHTVEEFGGAARLWSGPGLRGSERSRGVAQRSTAGRAAGEAASQPRSISGKEHPDRLELTLETASSKERYKKIALDHAAVDCLLVDVFLQAHREAPQEIILDWMRLTIRYTGSRKGASSMATMGTTAICRCTSSVENFCCARDCGRPTSMRRREVWKSCNAS